MRRSRRNRKRRKILRRTLRRLGDFAVEMLAEFAGNVIAAERERRLERDEHGGGERKAKAASTKEHGAEPRQH
jgi:hypothetical protein